MPSNKELASELWLHVNSPETLDSLVGAHVAKLRHEARFDELSDYQNERKEIDDAVEKYLTSPAFERYRDTFRDIDDRDSPELERAVSEMAREMRHGYGEMAERGREETMNQIAGDVGSLNLSLEQEPQVDEQQHEM